MNASECLVHRDDLAAFVDGELRGASVLRLLDHVERCEACAAVVADLRALGESIRLAAPGDPAPPELDGLASTVTSRTRAEHAESWASVLRRAQEDWHWMVVGAGAVAATFVSTLVLSAILAFGPKPDRQGSLSSYITSLNHRTPAGTLYLVATPVGEDREPLVLQVDEHGAPRTVVYATWYAERSRNEADVVDELQQIVMRDDRAVAFDRMTPERRRQTEVLLGEINRFRTSGPLPYGVSLAVHEVRLFASASVTVKGL
jgi:hypothetical protein